MTSLNTYTECLGCEVFTLPPAPTCVPKPRLSQVVRVAIVPLAAQLPTDWTDGAAWDDVINNASSTLAFGRILHGKGSVAEPVEASVTLGKIDRQITRRRYVLEYEMVVNDLSRAFLTRMQKGAKDFTFWYFTAGSILFGGASGVSPLVVSASMPLLGGANDFELGKLRIEFASDVDPVGAYVPDFADIDLYSGYLIDDGGEYLIDDNSDQLEV